MNFAFTLPSSPAIVSAEKISRRARLYGRDIAYTVNSSAPPNFQVTPAGDWRIAEGREALRQSLIRRLITEPGEWTTNPLYGVGALAFVKARDSQANRDELTRRIKAQFSQDARVKKVDSVTLVRGNDSLKIIIRVIPEGEVTDPTPLTITHEVK